MHNFINEGSVTSVQGFKAIGIHCGIKKKKKDLALIYSEKECTAAGTFTLNKVKAAPLVISKELISAKGLFNAILINSGNANACTGAEGHNDALISQKALAAKLGISSSKVLISSTGVIGQRLPMKPLLHGINRITNLLSASGGIAAAEAIMTTDTLLKSFALTVQLTTGSVTIGGIAKGSGMIMPNMATMLSFLSTDAEIESDTLQTLLSEAVSDTFNKISVDGDTSTNDMVVLLANGLSKIRIEKDTSDYQTYLNALKAICEAMAVSIVVDGEGATKLVTISILNAHSQADADKIAKSICNSPLVKTAINGCDANWGRIISAAGQSGADFNPELTTIHFNGVPILLEGFQIVLDEQQAAEVMNLASYTITLNLNQGNYSTKWWTCDFSQEYIKINANYRT